MRDQYVKWWARYKEEIKADFKSALSKIDATLHESHKKMLLAHYSSQNYAISEARLAIAAGYKNFNAANLQYGLLAKKISTTLGLPPHPDAKTSMIAEWRGDQKDEYGHGQWVLRDAVSKAIEELGWAKEETPHCQNDIPVPVGIAKPKEIVTQSIQRERDPQIRDWVLQTANGICECCKQDSPFEMEDSSLYLEVHHIRHLANGGSDRVSNTVALCPNCHRELHYGKLKAQLKNKLYASITRLIPE